MNVGIFWFRENKLHDELHEYINLIAELPILYFVFVELLEMSSESLFFEQEETHSFDSVLEMVGSSSGHNAPFIFLLSLSESILQST